jgi:hypothetical protein
VKACRKLNWFAFVLLSLPSLAWADEPTIANWTRRRVDEGLVKPLAKREGSSSHFSRGRPPPHERRVRVTQTSVSVDKEGREFVPFLVDIRFGSGEWENDIVGCAYRKTGDLYVKSGDAYRPAAFLFGKNVEPVAGACEAVPPAPPPRS